MADTCEALWEFADRCRNADELVHVAIICEHEHVNEKWLCGEHWSIRELAGCIQCKHYCRCRVARSEPSAVSS